MKPPYSSLRLRARERGAFTFIEILISSGVVAIAGAGVYLSLTAALNLFAKNTSVNVAHEQLLSAVARITTDVRASVATPTLLTASGAIPPVLSAHTGTGPAAGVVVQPMWRKPFYIMPHTATAPEPWSTSPPTGGRTTVLDTGGATAPRPSPGQRIIFCENHLIEDNITAVAANATTPGYSDVTIETPAWFGVNGTNSLSKKPAIITTPTAYVVWPNGELHCYRQQSNGTTVFWQDAGIIAYGVTSTTPFSVGQNWTYANSGQRTSATGFVPADLGGIGYQSNTQTYWRLTATTPEWVQTDSGNNLVTGTLTVKTPNYDNRGYQAIDMSMSFQAAYKAKLTLY